MVFSGTKKGSDLKKMFQKTTEPPRVTRSLRKKFTDLLRFDFIILKNGEKKSPPGREKPKNARAALEAVLRALFGASFLESEVTFRYAFRVALSPFYPVLPS